uniref:Uncharacterized protein n=1 Tax=Haptolina brevifila TaxID=156173 RepID=A0A7S2C8E4_9EUKA
MYAEFDAIAASAQVADPAPPAGSTSLASSAAAPGPALASSSTAMDSTAMNSTAAKSTPVNSTTVNSTAAKSTPVNSTTVNSTAADSTAMNSTANGAPGAPEHDALLSLVTFHFGDGTVGKQLDFTHVYAFDRVFSPTTMRALAAVLRRSPFYVFASFRSPSEWWACGLTNVHPVARLRVSTTGKEGMSVTIYANMRQAPECLAASVQTVAACKEA